MFDGGAADSGVVVKIERSRVSEVCAPEPADGSEARGTRRAAMAHLDRVIGEFARTPSTHNRRKHAELRARRRTDHVEVTDFVAHEGAIRID